MNFITDKGLEKAVARSLSTRCRTAGENLRWLREKMHPYFWITMQDEPEAVAALALRLRELGREQLLLLADRERRLIVARPNRPGSLYETLRRLSEREISYAQFTQSYGPMPGLEEGWRSSASSSSARATRRSPGPASRPSPGHPPRGPHGGPGGLPPASNSGELGRLLRLLWLNNESYVRISPPRRVAQLLWLYHQGNEQGGIYLDVEETEDTERHREFRVMFAAGNPPQVDFLPQTMEVFNRLGIGVKRAYCLTISNGVPPLFPRHLLRPQPHEALARTQLGALHPAAQGALQHPDPLQRLPRLPGVRGQPGDDRRGGLPGQRLHRLLPHQPRPQPAGPLRFRRRAGGLPRPPRAGAAAGLAFHCPLRPRPGGSGQLYEQALAEAERAIADYNTGHRYLDEVRRTVLRCALLFIRHTLKTNFFVPEKQALAFRLDPAYLERAGRRSSPPTCLPSARSASPSSSAATARATISASRTSPAAAGAPSSPRGGTTTSPPPTPSFARTTSSPTPST